MGSSTQPGRSVLPQYKTQPAVGSTLGPAGLAIVCLLSALYGVAIAALSESMLLALSVPLLVLSLLIIWVLPESKSGPVKVVQALFFTFLAVAVIWPEYLAIALPGLPWITFRRLVAVPMIIALLITLSVSKGSRHQFTEGLRGDVLLSRLVFAFVALQFASIFLSSDPSFSIDKFIVAQLYWTAIFLAACLAFRVPGSVEKWSALFCGLLLPLTILGLWEWTRSQVPWGGRLPSFLVVEDPLVQRILQGASRSASGKYRVQTTFVSALGYAEYMALTIPFLMHYLFGSYRFVVRVVAAVALPVTFFMIVLTDSRLGASGFMVSVVAYVGLWAAVRWRRHTRSVFAPALTIGYPIIFALFIASTLYVGRIRKLVWGGGEHQPSTDARALQYERGFEIVERNPFGHGIGRAAETLQYRGSGDVLTIDTYYLSVALEYGVLGVAIFYGLLIATVVRGSWRAFSAPTITRETYLLIPLSVSILVFIVIKSVHSSEANHSLIFMMIAAVIALSGRLQAPRPAQLGEPALRVRRITARQG